MENLENEFLRIPPRGSHCSRTGLSRSVIEQLVVPSKANNFHPPVPAKLLRRPGNTRGVWLIPKRAFIKYLNNLPESRVA